jgi:lipid-A-disaccharide synthase
MKYYVIAGEASGDLHGSNLLYEIRKKDPEAEFRCWGGDLMQAQGAEIVKQYSDLAFMGFAEVLINIRTILGNIKFCKKDILEWNPDAIILIDYPGFNLRIARFANLSGFKVFYYISPQLWAWKQGRVKTIRDYVNRMFVILPFEKAFYAKHNVDVDFVGHPLLDAISKNTQSKADLPDKPYIAILPGSRKQEIARMLPVMTSLKKDFPDYTFVVAAVPSLPLSFYQPLMRSNDVKIIFGRTYDILSCARTAIVTSGTATLETSLFHIPQVVCYKGSRISYFIARRLIGVKIKYISLVNLILDKPVVKELIQSEMNAKNIIKEIKPLLEDSPERKAMLEQLNELTDFLGGAGASERAAGMIVARMQRV